MCITSGCLILSMVLFHDFTVSSSGIKEIRGSDCRGSHSFTVGLNCSISFGDKIVNIGCCRVWALSAAVIDELGFVETVIVR
jgi:hypothetical protein